jgi:hypothetical protein
MRLRTVEELRESAKEFRETAKMGNDFRLREALLLVAEEFEREAARLDGIADGEAKPP